MFKTIAFALLVTVSGCLSMEDDLVDETEETTLEQDLFNTTNPTPPPYCDSVCGSSTSTSTTVCRDDDLGDTITCAERAARKGRNPQTGKTIQIKA